jgi:predicted nuclease of predicted toxin-antitoxin system
LSTVDGGILLRLLLDEMYAGLKEYFETLGWEVVTVQDLGLQGAKDRDIVDYAKRKDLLLVTQDQKPADLAELSDVKCVLISNALIAKIADEQIRNKYPDAKCSK